MNSRISVILADPNEDYRRVLQQTMQRSGEFSVVGSSGNGTEVWELVKRRAPQLVVMDMVLPGLSGLELLDQFSAMPRRPKAIMVSAFCQKQAVSRSLELGASAFISKPCETRTVLSQMRRVIRQSDPGGTESAAIESHIASILHDLGIPSSVKGYVYLREAIAMIRKNMSMINAVTKRVYPEIAARHGATPSSVERAICHAIEVAWDRGNSSTQQELFGCTVSGARGKPTNREFIALVADWGNLEYKFRAVK